MRKAFTLIELMVVIGIMGLLGTVSVGGYRAMQRGMEERGVLQNVESVLNAAYERAQIDRQPTIVYFWNETIRSASQDENEIVVGKAVAIRRQGRLSLATSDLLVDEFADLNLSYATDDSASDDDAGEKGLNGDGGGDAGENTMYLYCLDRLDAGQKMRSTVYSRVYGYSPGTEVFMQGKPTDSNSDSPYSNGRMQTWGFKIKDSGNVSWKKGSAYGFEFNEITLPHNYLFGSAYSTTTETPVKGENSMAFGIGAGSVGNGVQGQNSSGGLGAVDVYSLRPDGSGGLKAEKVGSVQKPE